MSMNLTLRVEGHDFPVAVGDGRQHVRWLGLVAAKRFQKAVYPHAFRIPERVLNGEGVLLRPRAVLQDELGDGEVVTVELRRGATIREDLQGEDDSIWIDEAYGAFSNLRVCRFQWKVGQDGSIPVKVRGDYFVAPQWLSVFPQKEYGGRFEVPLDPVDTGDGNIEWYASKRAPPGAANYRFVLEDGGETVCRALPPATLGGDGTYHHEEFPWDCPVADDPYPDVNSRPSTASSIEGAEVDPRFEEDWDNMKLKWVEPHMKLRVKDVLKEFYSILIDLYDSYAFMGLDLAIDDPTSHASHTIGLDDVMHVVLQANLISNMNYLPKAGRAGEGGLPIPWSEIIKWYEDASQVRDGRPYLSQRLNRNHYLEILLRVAHWVMCEHPSPSKQAQHVQMPLDEGLFRFLTDILIPVMDVFDDDPVRKDAVQHENLVAIQRARPNIRSIYAFLSQNADSMGEHVLSEEVMKFVVSFAQGLLNEDVSPGDEFGEMFQNEAKKLGGEAALKVIESHLELVYTAVTKVHLEPDESGRYLLFWEFFEFLMHQARLLYQSKGDSQNLGLHIVITQLVNVLGATVKILDARGVDLP